MAKYIQFTSKQFEYFIRKICIENKLGFLQDFTEQWKEENGETWERIYRIPTRNRAVDLIVFSSVDYRTGRVRANGSDAVRVVMRWRTTKGYIYKRVAKHYRLETLFKNLERTLVSASGEVFGLNGREFSKAV